MARKKNFDIEKEEKRRGKSIERKPRKNWKRLDINALTRNQAGNDFLGKFQGSRYEGYDLQDLLLPDMGYFIPNGLK